MGESILLDLSFPVCQTRDPSQYFQYGAQDDELFLSKTLILLPDIQKAQSS